MNALPEQASNPTDVPPPAPSGQARPAKSRRSSLRFAIAAIVIASAIGIVTFRYVQTSPVAPTKITLFGNVDVRQVNLSFKVGGRISSLAADEGEHMPAGQLIATLDPSYFKEELQLAQAQLDQARANFDRLKNGSRPEEIEQAKAQEEKARATLERTKKDLARAQKLIDSNSISKQEFDASRDAFLEAQATLQAAQATTHLAELGPRVEDISAGQARLDEAAAQLLITQRRLEDSKLITPNEGIILTRAREVGAIVNAGEVVYTLTLVSPVWVRTYVNETDLGRVQPGMKVTIETDTPRSYASDTSQQQGSIVGQTARNRYVGHVGFISPTAEFTPKSVETRELRTNLVYRMRIIVDDPNGGLRQGMPVTVTVNLQGTQPRDFYDRLLEAIGVASPPSVDNRSTAQ